MRTSSKLALVVVSLMIVSTAVAADIPLKNWTPAAAPASTSTHSGRLRNIGSDNYAVSFVTMPPCRIYDTRSFGAATPLAGGTSVTINPVTETYPSGFTPCTGIPGSATAYSVNITAFGATPSTTFAFITAFPTGSTRPSATTMNFQPGGQVSNAATIPTGSPAGSFDVYTTYTTHFVVDINGYYALFQNSGDTFASVSGTGAGVIGQSGTGNGVEGFVTGGTSGAAGVYGSGGASSQGVYGVSTNGIGVHGLSTNYNGVWADSTNWDAFAGFGGRDGGYFQGVRHGAVGNSATTGAAGVVYGVLGSEQSTTAGAAGVFGVGINAANGYSTTAFVSNQGIGVYGSGNGYGVVGSSNAIAGKFIGADTTPTVKSLVYLGTQSYAANFDGDVFVSNFGAMSGNLSVAGTLSKGAGSFKIDDPIDPENKYLYHSFVESPDMMNIYNGVIELDQNGEATVELPRYFEALNRDFRYQLTSIGRPQPDLYIADEVSNNTFRISGGRAHAKVSWSVTGIRQDPFANAHRIPNEIDKPASEKGLYLHPVEYGKEPTMSVNPANRKGALMDDRVAAQVVAPVEK